ncbi:YitT family protein [Prevotella brunnea]|uniref:YitT family protein n=1 Tax=Prevotella brunnea TaxID=2508867 RepID=A0A5C8GEU7_9BACT|nr:YitT family protein [Prevotella brunnea]MDR0187169.1 YitT family protein [Prevotella brunnea]TXJ60447.1 YitT family protein [Prevotella brunnea]
MEMKITRKALYREVLDYFMIALGCLSYGVGWTIFLLPNHIGNGGVAGLSSIIFWGTGTPVTVTYFVMNALLLTAALKTLGLRFCIKTIYGVLVLTMVTGLLREFVPNPTILHDQPFMTALIGAIFCGLGLGFCLSYNGSSGGSDIVAAIVHKYRDISLGRVIILVDMTIVTLSYLVLRSWEQVIYGYVCLVITAMVLDQVVNAGRRSVQFLIISERYKEICDMISSTPPHRGCTIIDAQGYYTGKCTKVVIVVTRQREAGLLYRMIDDIDPHAFVTQSQVMGVFGEGFDKFKVKHRNNKQQKVEA